MNQENQNPFRRLAQMADDLEINTKEIHPDDIITAAGPDEMPPPLPVDVDEEEPPPLPNTENPILKRAQEIDEREAKKQKQKIS